MLVVCDISLNVDVGEPIRKDVMLPSSWSSIISLAEVKKVGGGFVATLFIWASTWYTIASNRAGDGDFGGDSGGVSSESGVPAHASLRGRPISVRRR